MRLCMRGGHEQRYSGRLVGGPWWVIQGGSVERRHLAVDDEGEELVADLAHVEQARPRADVALPDLLRAVDDGGARGSGDAVVVCGNTRPNAQATRMIHAAARVQRDQKDITTAAGLFDGRSLCSSVCLQLGYVASPGDGGWRAQHMKPGADGSKVGREVSAL